MIVEPLKFLISATGFEFLIFGRPCQLYLRKDGYLDSRRCNLLTMRTYYGALEREWKMMTFLFWCVLLVLCWPLAIMAIIIYPLVWIILLPFRLLGIAVEGILELIRSIILLPSRLLSTTRH